MFLLFFFFFSSRRRHTRFDCDWSSDVCSSDLRASSAGCHAGEDTPWEPALLARATRRQILVRMLLNLKRLYVRWRSFPQARAVADLLLTLSPSAVTELRDRGLLAYHMNDFPAALRDLEEYLKVAKLGDADED